MNNSIKVNVELGERSYPITVVSGLLREMPFGNALRDIAVPGRRCLIVSDSNVTAEYGERVETLLNGLGTEVGWAVFPAGEEHKTLSTMADIYHAAVKCGLNRKSLIVALGGGVSGDIAGFAAATYMRGIDFIQIPTSLLAMVDSSVGGKTGVDLPEGKNLVGAFWQPKAVVIDPQVLRTLPRREIRCGLAEIIKYAVIIDWELFDILEENITAVNRLDLDFYAEIIARCCRIKADVVAQDEREGGIRALLNYGHTFGHAIEQVADFSIGHGEGVAIGMTMAAALAVKLGMCECEVQERQRQLLQAVGLPWQTNFEPTAIIEAMKNDKKSSNNKTILILPEKIGRAVIVDNAPSELILSAIKEYSCSE